MYQRRGLLDRGNDLPLFGPASTMKDGEWSAPVETISEVHLLRRDGFRPAPKYEQVEAVVRERVVDEKAQVWLSQRWNDDVQIAVR